MNFGTRKKNDDNDFGFLHSVLSKVIDLPEKIRHDSFRSNNVLRRRFYIALRDFVNAPNSPAPENFFQSYLLKLDSREAIAPPLIKWFRKVTKRKGDTTLRDVLGVCAARAAASTPFVKIMEPWLPNDEMLILRSNTKANLSDALQLAIELANEKHDIDQQLRSVISKNAPLIATGFFMHYVMYNFVLDLFANHTNVETKPWEMLSPIDRGYFIYSWLDAHSVIIGATIAGIIGFVMWANRNWHKRRIEIREAFFDYLPPFSVSKLNHQYMTLIAIESQMRQGISFPDSISSMQPNCTPYQNMQLQKVLSRVTESAPDAISTTYFGDWGLDIKERGEYHKIQDVIRDILPSMKADRNMKMSRILNRYVFGPIKPLIIITLIAAISPVVTTVIGQINDAKSLQSNR